MRQGADGIVEYSGSGSTDKASAIRAGGTAEGDRAPGCDAAHSEDRNLFEECLADPPHANLEQPPVESPVWTSRPDAAAVANAGRIVPVSITIPSVVVDFIDSPSAPAGHTVALAMSALQCSRRAWRQLLEDRGSAHSCMATNRSESSEPAARVTGKDLAAAFDDAWTR